MRHILGFLSYVSRPILGSQGIMSTVQSILVLVGLGGGSFIPAFVARDARWGLIVLFFLLFLLTAWAGYRLYCAAQPRFRVVPSIDIHPLSSSDMEALVVLTVENLSPVRLHDVIATLKAIRPLYDGADQDDQLERQLSPENGARRMQTFRLQMRKSNPPSAEFTAL